ncbi:MAG: hypothetical protein WD906_08075 [Anaerolineales bacterium]
MSEDRPARPTPAQANPTPAPGSSRPGRNAPGAFQPDYTHVVKDLRRIGALAGGILVVLLALALILR